MSQYEEIADAIIAKKPEFADIRDQMVAEVEVLHSISGMLIDNLDDLKPQIKAAVSLESTPSQDLRDEVMTSFATWGISIDKFATLFGVDTPEDVFKMVAMTLRQQGDTSIEKEAMKTFILASLYPEFDVLDD